MNKVGFVMMQIELDKFWFFFILTETLHCKEILTMPYSLLECKIV